MDYVSDGIKVSSDTVPAIVEALPVLGAGTGRRVYDLGAAVLKVDRFDAEPYMNCAAEIKVWETYKDDPQVRPLLADILAYDPNNPTWLVMEKVQIHWDARHQPHYSYDHVHELSAKLRPYALHGDCGSTNVGYKNGNLVIADYAHCPPLNGAF